MGVAEATMFSLNRGTRLEGEAWMSVKSGDSPGVIV